MSKNKFKKADTLLLKKDVLSFFQKNKKKKLNYKQVCRGLGIKTEIRRSLVLSIIEDLSSEKKIVLERRGFYRFAIQKTVVEGFIDVLLNGNAYVSVEGLSEDVFLRKKGLPNLVSGDKVLINSFFRGKKKKLEGEFLEVVGRLKNKFIGDVEITEKAVFVLISDARVNFDVFLPNKERKKIKNDQRVVVEIIDWGNSKKNPTGKVLEILGYPGEYSVELKSLLSQYNLSDSFSEKIISTAKKIPSKISAEEIKKRKDFRKTTTFTIDPDDAKDFDDAISVNYLKNGNLEIGVHIADVSFYVKTNDLIDLEAQKRATSVYLENTVVPMLPEIISNFLCSLRPKEEKLCFSSVFELDKNANIINQWFGKTIIFSDHRFTYKDAYDIIKNKKGLYKKELLILNDLALKLRKKRIKNGSISFERKETNIVLNKKNIPIKLLLKEVNDAHKLVEEFMLLANKKVAEFIAFKKLPFVYRIHDEPSSEKVDILNTLLKQFNYSIKTDNKKTIAKSINCLLKDVSETPSYNIIELLTIKTMSKAFYSTENIGHYGLAFNNYSHFTSPIRRYPDIMVHRLLNYYLKLTPDKYNADLIELCKHCSEKEINASKAEREFNKYLRAKYMMSFIGEKFNGIISHITDFGMFVEINNTGCEGFIRLKELNDDYYYFNENIYCIEGFNSGKKYKLGDLIKLKIRDINIHKKEINIIIV